MCSHYVAHVPDENGYVAYSETENNTWKTLYQRQIKVIQNRACDEYIHGLERLHLSENEIPQLMDVNKRLSEATGWNVAPVAAVIPFAEFFDLLAHKKFPAATFIRTPEDIDYLQEPDIFHEIFGHCPMLMHQVFADFCEQYGRLGVNATPKERVYLARIFWFTVEFGLIETAQGLRIYGAGILSSYGETRYALDSSEPERKPFEPLEILRTPYRIDLMQKIYYVIQNYRQIFKVMNSSIMPFIAEAMNMGLFEPTYEPRKTTTQTKKTDMNPSPQSHHSDSHPC